MKMGSDLQLQINPDNMSPARSRRSTSYCGSGPPTPTPIGCSRRSSMALNNHHQFNGLGCLPSIPQAQPLPSPQLSLPLDPIEVYAEPVDEGLMGGDRVGWEFHHVAVTRVAGYGFGIAVSGGRDNPHFANGDPSIAVSDVLKAGPAEDRLLVNDRILSVNGISLENVEYATAVQVLRDSGNTVTLVVKRRAAMLPSPGQGQGGHSRSHSYQHQHQMSNISNNAIQSHKATLTKNGKKEDFGVILGCRLFIKELSSKARDQLNNTGQSLMEGDILTRINNTNCNDMMSLKEARKIIEGCKERLSLVVSREVGSMNPSNTPNMLNSTVFSHNQQNSHCSLDDALLSGPTYSSQNLYVVPPTRPAHSTLLDDKSNLLPRGRSRNPLLDVSLSQLDRPSTPQGHSRSRSTVDEPPRPPPPRVEDYYSSRKQLFEEDPLVTRNKQPVPEPRYITFQKEGSVGIRLTGGNEVGIFVTAVQPGSPASLQGLTPGDKILKVNDMDMKGVTREEAVLFLLSLQEQIDLIVQHCKEEYDHIVASQKGDSFNVKTHFHYSVPLKGESGFRSGDVFRVLDTLYNGVVGAWQVLRIGRNNLEMQKGVIPNKARAEELATAQFNATKKELSASESRGNFFRRRRSSHRRSKSLSREHWDDVVFSDSVSKFPAYERVVLRHPGFMRPVVLFGAVADLARDRLLKDFPDKFTAPQLDNNLEDPKSPKAGGIIRLSGIRDIMDRGRHALLDITPNAVDRLNYAQFYPIVIFLKADSKHTIKQHRHGIAKSAHKSSKKLLEQGIKLERVWGHVFSGQVTLGEPDAWYRKLRDLIDQLQAAPVWVSETKPEESLSDDFLFPMTSRLSYASSPESDLELSPGPRGLVTMPTRMAKASSDPSIATTQDNLDRDNLNLSDAVPPPYTSPYEHSGHTRRSGDSKYGFAANGGGEQVPPYIRGQPNIPSQGLYGVVPDLPPRVDRGVKPSPGGPRIMPSGGGTLSRSAQERLFGQKGAPDASDPHDDTTFSGVARNQSGSLDRQRGGHKGVGSYDSVSSYDSYNNTLNRDSLGLSNTRLGPNAPDDLKSVPNSNKFDQMASPRNSNSQDRAMHDHRNSNSLENRNSNSHESNRNSQEMNRNYHDPNRNSHDISRNSHEQLSPRSSQDGRSHDPYRFTRSTAQPIGADQMGTPPRKPTVETKTDYGKYSRNNSTSQADYKTNPNKPVPPLSPGGPSSGGPPGGSYKPVPPPKPKNYRPPAQGWPEEPPPASLHHAKSYSHNGHAHNGMDPMPRSPNGYGYYNTNQSHQVWPNPSHTHSMSQPMPAGHPANPPLPNIANQSAGHYGQGYGGGHPNNYGHNNGMSSLNGPPHYMQRSPHAMPNVHMSDRHHGNSLDLAGSREQRGSAFELYRKPQAIGHHHNMSEMEHEESSSPRYKRSSFVKKSPLANLKDMFKGAKTLRRQNSLCEKGTQQKARPILRRQNSMLESCTRFESPRQTSKVGPSEPIYEQRREVRHEPFYQTKCQAMFQSREEALLLENSMRESIYQNHAQVESAYANRMELRHSQSMCRTDSPYMTRQQIEERVQLEQRRRMQIYQTKKQMTESIYQSRNETKQPIYQSRGEVKELIYQRGREAQEPIYTSKREIKEPIYQSRREIKEPIYISKREIKEPINQSKGQELREPIYQSRREIKEPIYISKREIKEPIYQSRREIKEPCYQSRNEIKEPCYQSRGEIKELIYQSKRELKEPIYQRSKDIQERLHQSNHENCTKESIYQSRGEVQQTVYESKDENIDETRNQIYQTRREALATSLELRDPTVYATGPLSQDMTYQSRRDAMSSSMEVRELICQNRRAAMKSAENREQSTPVPLSDECNENDINSRNQLTEYNHTQTFQGEPVVQTRLQIKSHHISNAIKKTARMNPESPYDSRTSIETQYVSQGSIKAPPNAHSTPYASQFSLQHRNRLMPPHGQIKEPVTCTGTFGPDGGTLKDDKWGVSLFIPPGAIPVGKTQNVHFTVTDPRHSHVLGGPPLDCANGEAMLSPLVMCGPQGLDFLEPVTLNIPHYASSTASLGLSLKATDSEHNLQTDWDNIQLPSNTAANMVSVKVDHF